MPNDAPDFARPVTFRTLVGVARDELVRPTVRTLILESAVAEHMPTAYVTVPLSAADDVVETLLEERLAACVNHLPIRSTYRWDGEVHRDEEALLLAKTTEETYDDLVERVREVHPHEVPCIERFDEDHVLESYADWVDETVE